MIRRSPEVPAAVELADVTQAIFNNEFRFLEQTFKGLTWNWQSPSDFDPLLKIVVYKGHTITRLGKIIVTASNLIIYDGSDEYHLHIPVSKASKITDDPYIEDFVTAFRQYNINKPDLLVNG